MRQRFAIYFSAVNLHVKKKKKGKIDPGINPGE